mmetsp:Transcript_21376/g.24221  ORF Transcript_21376/g.24221 Transcript_21376/m.24221 type:complete len:165 (-) Transcript_21376:121-615(-)
MSVILPLKPKEVFDHLNQTEKIPDWDSQLGDSILLDPCYKGYEIWYSRLKLPFPASDRGFVNRKLSMEDTKNDVYVIILTAEGVEEYEYTPRTAVQMGHTYCAAQMITGIWDDDGQYKTELRILNQTDLKGLIPVRLIDLFGPAGTLGYCQDIRRGLGLDISTK